MGFVNENLRSEAGRENRQTAKAKAKYGVLRCAQNDEVWRRVWRKTGNSRSNDNGKSNGNSNSNSRSRSNSRSNCKSKSEIRGPSPSTKLRVRMTRVWV